MKRSKYRFIHPWCLLAVLAVNAVAQSNHPVSPSTLPVRIDQFLTRNVEGLDTRYSPLRRVSRFDLPEHLLRVDEAINHVLLGSGFRLCTSNAEDANNAAILAAPIPTAHRDLDDLSVIEAVKVLIGPHHDILIDPVSREVGFGLNEYGRSLRSPGESL